MSEIQEWTTVIKPKDKFWSVDFKELWKYRDLTTLFVKRNIITQYKQTILGPLWFVSDCLNKTSNTFVSNSGLFGKVYFPRLIVPIANVTSNLLRFGIQLSLFIVVYIIYAIIGCEATVNWYALLSPVLVVMMAGLALGFGILISSLTTKYRDLQILFSFIVQLWMYATPIVYPLSLVKGKTAAGMDLYTIMHLNPVTPVLETFKYGVLGAGEFIGWGWLAYSFIFMVVLLVFGVVIFNKTQKSFMDTV